MNKKWIIGAVAGVAVLGGAFGVSAVTGADDDRFQESDVSITQAEAEATATEEVGTLTIQEVEKDRDGDRYVYEIEGKEADVDVDANSGEVLKVDREDDSNDDNSSASNVTVNVTKEEAEQTAIDEVNVENAKIVETELDDDGHYEIELKDGQMEYEVKVDASTGDVLKSEKERDDD
ncbi:PepSY domain-containing protein [Halobacillus litoralis]|uniref:PepSY domain-containing protein n=1 Tax=Halobacillus litoralis TaxID=45668 RepID=UPI001CD6FF78|nr:PepSY domain-containing protein [Halobacillus litoralis]MCA0970561.1 PepSY domain-containing protein [Halobacillus litoralis]